MEESIKKADILIEAIPYIQAFRGKVIVAKYGGSAIENVAVMGKILEDLVFLSSVGIHAVLVHGGGPAITRKLSSVGRKSRFIDGMRVTDRDTMHMVSQALGDVNRRLVAQVKAKGGHAEGVVPDHRVIVAEPHPRSHELGFVGSVKAVQTAALQTLFSRHAVPVISPIGVGKDGQTYNVNADQAAGSAGHQVARWGGSTCSHRCGRSAASRRCGRRGGCNSDQGRSKNRY